MKVLTDSIYVNDEFLAHEIARLLETKSDRGTKFEITMTSSCGDMNRIDHVNNKWRLDIYRVEDLH